MAYPTLLVHITCHMHTTHTYKHIHTHIHTYAHMQD